MDHLTPAQLQVIERLKGSRKNLQPLREAFPDPADAFVCAPFPITIHQLIQLYEDDYDEAERHTLPGILRRRMSTENWLAQRAQHQQKRIAMRRDALLETEAQVLAVMSLEFHQTRLSNLMTRYAQLSEYVLRELLELETNVQSVFSLALKNAMTELMTLEKSIADIIPALPVHDAAVQQWTAKGGSRSDMIEQASTRLLSIASGDRASHVFELLDGGVGDDG